MGFTNLADGEVLCSNATTPCVAVDLQLWLYHTCSRNAFLYQGLGFQSYL
jgi:hypothetical protein